MSKERVKLVKLIDSLISGSLGTDDFCESYIHGMNFEVNRSDLDENEREIFEPLFDFVAFYSPYPEDRKSYPGYKDEMEILEAAREARLKIE